jgi:type II secretion system protein H
MRASGFTLLELLLVLTLLVVVGGIVSQSLRGPIESQRLRRSSELLRIALGRARVKAMQSGQTQVFQYEVAGRRYKTQPLALDSEASEWGLDAFDQSDQLLQANDPNNPDLFAGTGSKQVNTLAQLRYQLPEGIVFQQGATEIDLRMSLAQEELAAIDQTAQNWSQPILFYPDGSTSEARLFLSNQAGVRFIAIRLRSLTGIPVVSGVLSQEELPQ